ncbi:CBN-MRP-5 protein [Aphelenchoides avenae]|nr:CBN-MRP-5 protein [Aphelenchus avenae]
MGQNGKAELVETGDETVHIVLPENKNASACAKIDEVGWISFVSFAWVFSFLWSVYKGRIDPSRPTTCSIFDSANVNVTRLEHLWSEELKRKPENPSLFMVILRFMKLRLLLACLIFVFCLVFGFIGPTCLVRGLISFTETEPSKERIDYSFGLYLVLSILIVEVSRVLMYGATWAVSYRTGIRVRGAVLALLYKNMLSVKSLRDKTPSEIVNICANDGQRIFDAVTFAPLVLIGPLVIVGGLIYLLRVIGPWSLLGVAVFFVFDLLQAILGITMVKCRNLAIAKTEKRMTLMGEIIRCIRTIKMNAWEDLFAERVMAVREEERRYLRIAGYAQSLAIASGTIVPVVATIVTVLSVVLSGSDLLASDAFSAITVFFVMLFGIRMIPYGIRHLAEARSAIVKIQELLLFPKCEKDVPTPVQPNVAIALKNASFSWDAAEKLAADNKKPEEESLKDASAPRPQCLQKLTLTVEKKELIGVCGSVGSGKSALLSGVLGHLIEDEGDLSVAGSVAHVGQVPFILNTTVRENILFGQPMNTQRYYKVISACQLTKDLEAMPSNELSEVGERGTALSGGQRARLALARALYANKDIYLLDDVFASIDKKISDAIFENAIKDLLATKTVLLVTSDPDYLAKCDRVMLLDRSSLVEFDTHKELLDKSELYKEFFASHQSDAARRHGDEHVPAKDTPAVNGTVKNGHLQKDTLTAGDIQQC